MITVSAQTLEELKASYQNNPMNPAATLRYMNALKGQKGYDKKEYAEVANNYVLVNTFYVLMKENPVAAESLSDELKNIDVDAIGKMRLPLNKLRKTQLDYLIADKKHDVKAMTKLTKKLVDQPMPKDNMCDAVIYGFILQKTIEAGTLDDSKAFVAWLKQRVGKPLDQAVQNQLKGAIENGEGYIMLKEFDAQEGN